jgi:alkanesulfonate monooxygenase SsuD/methylene tetrahydromethanopterin reductase-like flavin-dependent oxidoreductase (luciferase family)
MDTDLVLSPMGASYAEMRAAAAAAEEAGFAGVWVWDHLRDPGGAPAGVPESLTTLAALAEATRRVMLGTLVLNVNLRHPGLVANMVATVQQVSRGRVMLGIGAGGGRELPYAAEQEMLDIPVEPDPVRRAKVRETIAVLRRLWSGDRTDFEGRHYRLRRPAGYLRPEPAPPLIVGGFGPKMAALAGRHGDGFNAPASSPLLPDLVRTARDAAAAAGRDPAALTITVFAGLTERWLRPASPDRAHLRDLGVARLILLASPPYDPPAIREAGRVLSAG